MQNQYNIIENKLHQFIRKFYFNELIRGTILFISLGLIYFFFTLFIEYFLWLTTTFRTLLFWLFVVIETLLFTKFILIPIFKLIGLKQGISIKESSKIIGNHFPEVKDKLLNVIQLKETENQSDLLLASIAQKSRELQPIPFQKAVDFKRNYKYLKYALIPVFIYLISLLTNLLPDITSSFDRVVHYKTSYIPPAPFSFVVENEQLSVVQGKDITISASTLGSIVPKEIKIFFDNQQSFMNFKNGKFYYEFKDIQKPISFYLEANNVQSKNYSINVIGAPTINNILLDIKYPNYLNKSNEIIQNNANIMLPEGTEITWSVTTSKTDSLSFFENNKRTPFKTLEEDKFSYSKIVRNNFNYEISSSNKNLKNYEILRFSVSVIKDEDPEISITSNIDSISRGDAQFEGRISDDYGITKLQIVYYPLENRQKKETVSLPITNDNIQTFFHQFPLDVSLEPGVNYELFYQVFDNDGFNGYKSSKSQVFTYRQKTDEELEQELLEEQKNTIDALQNSLQNQEEQQEQLENLKQELQNKKDVNWNDKKKVERFVKRQKQYKQMMERQTDKLQQNLDEIKESEKSLEEKKQDLKERVNELKKLDKQQRLLDEIQKMADKLNKEDLVEKAKELAQQNKQQQRSLEKTLEMVKRFYIEQKTMQISNKLNELSKEQDSLSKQNKNIPERQEDITKDFNKIKEELNQLSKDNQNLKKPLDLPDVEQEKQEVSKLLEKTKEQLTNKEQTKAKQSQKRSSKKMKEMSKKMEESMLEMQGDAMEENIDDLRKILENLIIFSFEQEQLMNDFDEISITHPNFGKNLKKQNEIKTYFNHIDDSLYVLSMRVPRISNFIQDDLSAIHYNLDQSLENFAENSFGRGTSNQRYVMTSTNNLADYLSNILNNMMNNMSMKMGKGQKSNENSLPDIIQKQKGLSEKMKEGLQKGEKSAKGKQEGKEVDKKGENGESGEDLDGELYEIFKEQSKLRQQLQETLNNNKAENSLGNSKNAKKVLKTMEELENRLLEKGFNLETLKKMEQLNYEFLKLETAKLKQGEDKDRISETNFIQQKRNRLKALEFKKQYFNQIEILNRQSLPLQEIYKRRVRKYFSDQKQ